METAEVVSEAQVEDGPQALLAQGRRLWRQGRHDQARRTLERALAASGLDPRIVSGSVRGELLFLRGMCHLQEGRESEGVEDLEAAALQGWLEARFQLAQHYARKGRRGGEMRRRAISHLQQVLAADAADASLSAGRDRVCFALGGLYAGSDEPEDIDHGIAAYRQGLSENPLSAAGHNSLGQLLTRFEPLSALGEFKVALQLDPDLRAAYSNLARLLLERIPPQELAAEFAHIVEEFQERAPEVLARLSQELVELGREQAYRGLYTKGHQLKNLMGLVGSRLRRLTRRVPLGAGGGEELRQIEQEHGRLYEEWVGYLSAMTPDRLVTGLVDPARVARRVVSALGADRPDGLTIRVQEGVPRIEADERLLREAVTNLCINAIQAVAGQAPPGKVSVGVGFDVDGVFIEVEDSGPGIPGDVIDHIFDPGFTTREQGNGYGLAIAQRIAQAHHGDLRVKSRVGHGTVFRLDLPVNYDADSTHEQVGAEAP